MSFTIEQIYRCNRVTYCRETGITPIDLITSLQAEIKMLKISHNLYREEYRTGGSITLDEQRERSSIIYVIRDKIDRKTSKIKDIKREFSIK